MRNPIVMGLAIAALTLTQASAAAPSPGSTDKPTVSTPTAKAPAPQNDKHAACEKTWKAQTKHTGKHKAFIAACVAKG